MQIRSHLWPLVLVAFGALGVVWVCRALGFGDGLLLGATPASGLALVGALLLRWPAAAAAAPGFVAADLAWGLPPAAAAIDGAAHGLAAVLAWRLMRALARRHGPLGKTSEWLVFLAGVCTFTAAVAGIVLAAALAGVAATPLAPWRAALLAAIFEPLGIMTFCAFLLTLREYREVLANPGPAVATAALGVVLLAALAVLLAQPLPHVSAPGITLLLSVPFCLWIAMQRRSLDGGAISFLAAHAALLLILGKSGSVTHGDYVATVLYLNLLVATCQLVHAVNRDRLHAIDEIAAHKRELEARVAERTAKLSAMTERALAADAAKSKFVATVSHEVRTPLNGVIGLAAVLLARDLEPSVRRNVEVIHSSGLHLLDVINRILDFSRLGHEPAAEQPAAFDLRELVAEVIEEARYAPQAAGLRLVVEVEPGLAPRRLGLRQALRQVVTNLVGNGIKFTERGSVTVRVMARGDGWVRIEVEDTGIGVPADVQERIFRPFEQADAGMARRFGGTGLGLAICAELVERMGGRIGVVSESGSGACFWVELPLARADRPVSLALGA